MLTKETLIRYILADLPEEERERVEQEYFADDRVWFDLNAIETDLIDSYVRGDLPPQQRERFEKYALSSPRRQQRLEFARARNHPAVKQALAGEEGSTRHPDAQRLAVSSKWVLGLSVSMAGLLAALSLVLFLENRRQRDIVDRTQTQNKTLEQELAQVRNEMEQAKSSSSIGAATPLLPLNSAAISLVLTPGTVRNTDVPGGNRIIQLPSRPLTVALFLGLESDEYSRYDVILRSAEGKEVLHLKGLESRRIPRMGNVVVVTLPSQLLRRGDYVALLSGQGANGIFALIDSYTFSVAGAAD